MKKHDHADHLRGNRLLALLDDADLGTLAPHLNFVAMKVTDPVMTLGRPIRHAWFPIEGVISMLAAAEPPGKPIEVGTIGREGMAGLPLVLGRSQAPGPCFVQVPGCAWKMPAAAFEEAARSMPAFADVLHRYAHALLVQASQGSACNRAHNAVQRCARWLLMTHDRVRGDAFALTQEFLAQMLGERRPAVSKVASLLKNRRLIGYSRGVITVLDREGLEDMACPCYGIIQREYEAVLGAGARR